jgi:general secretion pathway protein F
MQVRLNVVRGLGAAEMVSIEAANVAEARREAERRGFHVLTATGRTATLRNARQQFDIPVFVEQLRDLLVAGLSVVEALSTLEAGSSKAAHHVIQQLLQALSEGRQLSDALQIQDAFPALLIALVRASELTSDLPLALGRYLEHERRVTELRHRIASVSIYPLLVTGVGTLVLLFLAVYVTPRFARVFEGVNGELPWSARAMVAWSHWLHDHTVLLAMGGGVAVAALAMLAASTTARTALMSRIAEIGPIQERLRIYFLARWYRATGMLVEGGIPLPEALGLTGSLLPAWLRQHGSDAERRLRDGLSPSEAYVKAGMATPVAEQLMRAGERTGDLGTVLTRVAIFHEAEITRSLERSMRALEPIVMTLIGVGVGIVVVMMYLPIFELASALQ